MITEGARKINLLFNHFLNKENDRLNFSRKGTDKRETRKITVYPQEVRVYFSSSFKYNYGETSTNPVFNLKKIKYGIVGLQKSYGHELV